MAQTELQYLADPVKLNVRVRYYLANDDLFRALRLVRLAGPRIRSVVSWNGIVNYVVSKREFAHAMKLFNEMKKRSQFPDAFTYAQLLHGFAQEPVTSQQAELAAHLYATLDAENSRVKKNSFIMNAAVKVYANAGDWDRMWALAGEFTEFGPCAPDVMSFEAMFGGLSRYLSGIAPSEPDRDEKIKRGIQDATKIWQDMLRREKEGKLKLDQRIATTYARVLLLGSTAENAKQALSVIALVTGVSVEPDTPGEQSIYSPPRNSVNEGEADDLDLRNVLITIALQACTQLLPEPPSDVRSAKSYWKALTVGKKMKVSSQTSVNALRCCIMTTDTAWAVEVARELHDADMLSKRLQLPRRKSSPPPRLHHVPPKVWLLAMKTCAKTMESESFVALAHNEKSLEAQQDAIEDSAIGSEKGTPKQGIVNAGVKMPLPLEHAADIFRMMSLSAKNSDGTYAEVTLSVPAMRDYLSTALSTQNAHYIFRTLQDIRSIVDPFRAQLDAAGPGSRLSQLDSTLR